MDIPGLIALEMSHIPSIEFVQVARLQGELSGIGQFQWQENSTYFFILLGLCYLFRKGYSRNLN